jgi:hypothetical protein
MDRRSGGIGATPDGVVSAPDRYGTVVLVLRQVSLFASKAEGFDMDMDHDSTEQQASLPNGGAECGLASALLGATVFLASPVVAILAAQLWAHGDRTPNVILLHAWLARAAVSVPILLILTGLWFGASGIHQARRAGASAALPVAGLLLNVMALCAWVLAGIALLNTTESMLWLAQ